MELIELINLENDVYLVKYFGTDNEIIITNIDFPVVGQFDFIDPKRRVENNTFIRICNGNINDENESIIAVYILQSTSEGVHYLINVDTFNEIFEEV